MVRDDDTAPHPQGVKPADDAGATGVDRRSPDQALADAAISRDARGLIGGDLERRVAMARVPPLEHPFILAPFRRPGDDALFRDFATHRPLHIEIGFGRPHYILDLATANPEAHIIGFEIKRQWVRAAAERAARLGLTNIRVIEGDARPHLEALVPAGTADGIHVLFPDPWWKKKHHKKRVFNAEFSALMARTISRDGAIFVKTDVEAYGELLVEELTGTGLVLGGSGTDDPLLAALPQSHREKKCLEFQVPIHLFRFVHEA